MKSLSGPPLFCLSVLVPVASGSAAELGGLCSSSNQQHRNTKHSKIHSKQHTLSTASCAFSHFKADTSLPGTSLKICSHSVLCLLWLNCQSNTSSAFPRSEARKLKDYFWHVSIFFSEYWQRIKTWMQEQWVLKCVMDGCVVLEPVVKMTSSNLENKLLFMF